MVHTHTQTQLMKEKIHRVAKNSNQIAYWEPSVQNTPVKWLHAIEWTVFNGRGQCLPHAVAADTKWSQHKKLKKKEAKANEEENQMNKVKQQKKKKWREKEDTSAINVTHHKQ